MTIDISRPPCLPDPEMALSEMTRTLTRPQQSQRTRQAQQVRRTPQSEVHAAETLQRCRRLVEPALREAVSRLHPWPARMAAFAFGWCETDGTPRSAQGGKGLRPAIAMLCGKAAGAAEEAAVSGAVAVELIHAFSLVHDDIMDGDERRRHRETVWKAYGTGGAVITGDALLALAVDTLIRARAEQVPEAMSHLSTTLVELVQGQAEDIAFERRPLRGPNAVTIEEYCLMAGRKTGALLGCAAAIGTLLGGGSPTLAQTMSRLGWHLGLAFQAVDDLLGIWGDPNITGKPVFNDLRKRKKTLPVVAAVDGAPETGIQLARLLDLGAKEQGDEGALRQAAELIEVSGGASYTREQAVGHLGQVLDILDTTTLDPRAAEELSTLSRFVIHRTH
jgi:geranylgeranyl diphosphate synthase, type I